MTGGISTMLACGHMELPPWVGTLILAIVAFWIVSAVLYFLNLKMIILLHDRKFIFLDVAGFLLYSLGFICFLIGVFPNEMSWAVFGAVILPLFVVLHFLSLRFF